MVAGPWQLAISEDGRFASTEANFPIPATATLLRCVHAVAGSLAPLSRHGAPATGIHHPSPSAPRPCRPYFAALAQAASRNPGVMLEWARVLHMEKGVRCQGRGWRRVPACRRASMARLAGGRGPAHQAAPGTVKSTRPCVQVEAFFAPGMLATIWYYAWLLPQLARLPLVGGWAAAALGGGSGSGGAEGATQPKAT